MNHCSTFQERVSMVSQMLANPIHGLVSQLGRSHQVSRQSLYRWAATGRQALEEALGEHLVPPRQNETIAPVVLTLLNHALA
jgi:hypothetical protein